MDEREGYVDDNIGKLMKWVEDPIKNDGWLELENCWQSLGALRELKNALDSNYPEDYCSNIPIHQDGSCNGLQHYAALGRDTDGAFEVNLIKREKPGDVYTKVMQLVIQKIKEQL
jgi:DNA-directed RNA polymerase